MEVRPENGPQTGTQGLRAPDAELHARRAGEDQTLIDQIAAAIYEWSCQPHKWPDAHPHDVLAYRGDAHAVMAAVVRPLLDRAKQAEAAVERARAALDATA
ncbi:hypothetical protein ABT154_21490 [Streptomyces sp. NPDC001728]|uniref:hypothetical protein n=1 Tax=Streptomyces sp. NPDC001728 TaxID=3154396 RepID=UPI00331CDE81